MNYETIIYEVDAHIATITLNRPERLNAFTQHMSNELKDAWTQVKTDPEVRCAIVTGAGEKAFCTGVDVTGYIEEGDFEMARKPRSKPA